MPGVVQTIPELSGNPESASNNNLIELGGPVRRAGATGTSKQMIFPVKRERRRDTENLKCHARSAAAPS